MQDLTRVPVVIGAGQFTNRDQDPQSAPDPFELMTEAAQLASKQAGKSLGDLTHCWMVHSLSLRHGDPAKELAHRLGAPANAEIRLSGMGGNIPQWLVNRAADLVRSGERPVVLIVGAEALATKRRAKKAGIRLGWPSSDGWPDMWPPLEPDMGVHPVEDEFGLRQATAMYALVESAIAHSAGRTPAEHSNDVGRLMSSLNEVAAKNPYSWFCDRRSAEEIMTVTAENRVIYAPYPKYVNAVMDVDMSAAIIVTDAGTAREAGLGSDGVAYLRGCANANDVWFLSERPAVDKSPALERCAANALGQAGIRSEELSAFDLYACFPSSVEVARDAFGISAADPRPLTLTGGLPYHGGPGSNYVTHAVCNALEHVRSGKGPVAVHGNGYYLTKHAVGVYSAEAPSGTADESGGAPPDVDGSAQASTSLEIEKDVTGAATIVAWTVPYDRDGSFESGIVLLDSASCRRTIARSDERLTQKLLELDHDLVGSRVDVSADHVASLV